MSELIFNIVFYATAVVVIFSGALAVFARNIINAAFALFFTLLGMAVFFVMLGADFLAITQIVVYVGGILVLLLFGVMLTRRAVEKDSFDKPTTYIGGAIAGVLLFVSLMIIIVKTQWINSGAALYEPTSAPIGLLLLSKYLLPFEVASITLLIALIGAAYIVRRKSE